MSLGQSETSSLQPRAFYSEQHRCWYVPVSCELWESKEQLTVEPARVEFRDGQLWITRLSAATDRALAVGAVHLDHSEYRRRWLMGQSVCPDCEGTGVRHDSEWLDDPPVDKCPTCKGRGTLRGRSDG